MYVFNKLMYYHIIMHNLRTPDILYKVIKIGSETYHINYTKTIIDRETCIHILSGLPSNKYAAHVIMDRLEQIHGKCMIKYHPLTGASDSIEKRYERRSVLKRHHAKMAE